MTRLAALAALFLTLLAPPAWSQPAGQFAQAAYRTPLAGVCPDPFIIQKDWLAQSEHGGLYQLIGARGRMSQGRYDGPLGATGITLTILEGGSGLGLGDGETAYSALYMGNSRARLRPHLVMHDLDNAFIYSRRFPAIGVVSMLDKSPSVLFWDRATYPRGFHSIADLAAFARSGRGKIYVSTIRRTFGRYLVVRGVPRNVFIEGYRGDGENFVINNGAWLNQGVVSNEVYQFSHGRNWARPIDYLLLSDLGYTIYPGMLSVAADRLPALAPCLQRLVPLLQRAQIDYVRNPAEVNDLLFRFNQAGMGAPWWRTSRALLDNAVEVQLANGIVGNGPNATLGDFDMPRVAALLERLRSDLDIRAKPGVRAEDVVTNRFIDPAIGLR
ncbi:MAG: hypothetical protein JNJ73_14990 [Hyphomonadaceae bacterium]|nr:hypothetical protein [Hyphomonadaceae bacterium]